MNSVGGDLTCIENQNKTKHHYYNLFCWIVQAAILVLSVQILGTPKNKTAIYNIFSKLTLTFLPSFILFSKYC